MFCNDNIQYLTTTAAVLMVSLICTIIFLHNWRLTELAFYCPFRLLYEVDLIKLAWMQVRHQDVCSHVFMALAFFYDWYAIVGSLKTASNGILWTLFKVLHLYMMSKSHNVLFSQARFAWFTWQQHSHRMMVCVFLQNTNAKIKLQNIVRPFTLHHYMPDHYFDQMTPFFLAFKTVHRGE